MNFSTAFLLQLPPELLLQIAKNLPLDGRLALSFTHSSLYETLCLPPDRWNIKVSECAHLAIRTYLVPPNANPSHIRCIRCKEVYPPTLFYSRSSPFCKAPPNDQNQEVLHLPERFCAWHVGSLIRAVHTEAGGKNEWIANRHHMCMHCGVVKEWRQCDCNCDSCWYKPVTAYTRYLNNAEEFKEVRFFRTSSANCQTSEQSGQLFAKETCYDHGKPTTEWSRVSFANRTSVLMHIDSPENSWCVEFPIHKYGNVRRE